MKTAALRDSDTDRNLTIFFPKNVPCTLFSGFMVGWKSFDGRFLCVGTVYPFGRETPSIKDAQLLSARLEKIRIDMESYPLNLPGTLQIVGLWISAETDSARVEALITAFGSIAKDWFCMKSTHLISVESLAPFPMLLRSQRNVHIVMYNRYEPSTGHFYAMENVPKETRETRARSGRHDGLEGVLYQMNFSSRLEEILAEKKSFSLNEHVFITTVVNILLFIPSLIFHGIKWGILSIISLKVPSFVPILGKRTIKLLECRLEELASWPQCLKECSQCLDTNSEIRCTCMSFLPLYPSEITGTLELYSSILLIIADWVLGLYSCRFLLSQTDLPVLHQSASSLYSSLLKQMITWMMGSPAGFKLNVPLATIIGNAVLMVIDVWNHAVSFVMPSLCAVVKVVAYGGCFGATFQLALVVDIIEWMMVHIYFMYLYFSRLHHLQLGLLSSLWKLFLGRKKNILRNRVDSCEYDSVQLLIGTLLFTVLFFLATTNSVFYVAFLAVRSTILLLTCACYIPIVVWNGLPLVQLVYRCAFPACMPRNIHFDFVQYQPLYSHLRSVPLPISAIFYRYSTYAQQLAKHYTVKKILARVFFGVLLEDMPESLAVVGFIRTPKAFRSTAQEKKTKLE